jgi:hypothetical protein
MSTAPAPAGERTSYEWVEWVIGLDAEPVRRNYLMTQTYHDLSTALAAVLGAENANWCTFATWASRTAGSFIRDDEVPLLVRLLLERLEHVRIAHLNDALVRVHEDAVVEEEGLFQVIRGTIHDVAMLVAGGNLEVFGELAPIFSRSLEALAGNDSTEALDELAASLRPGLTQQGGQALLASALRNYAAARDERDERRKAALMLLANGQVGLHSKYGCSRSSRSRWTRRSTTRCSPRSKRRARAYRSASSPRCTRSSAVRSTRSRTRCRRSGSGS